MNEIEKLDAWEVLDSRGNPTVRVRVKVDGSRGIFTVPAGASTGTHEALEIRDKGRERFGGKGVLGAIEAVRNKISPLLEGREATDQEGIDRLLLEEDGTPNLSSLGANSVLGVSGAVARAAASSLNVPLYEYLSIEGPGKIPISPIQMLGGGLHAEGGIEIQDFSIIPVEAETYLESLEIVWSVRKALKEIVVSRGNLPLIAEEGGFGLPFKEIDEAFELLEEGIDRAGYEPDREGVAIALDVAASHFYDSERGAYVLETLDLELDTEEMIDFLEGIIRKYPIVSLEDPLSEDDWCGWTQLMRRVGEKVQLIGDDLLATNVERLGRAIEENAVNAILVKPNQVGTITQTIEVVRRAKESEISPVVSARSGETCDSTISDLAVALNAGQLKVGSIRGSERLSKFNRLLEIDKETELGFAGTDSFPIDL